MKSVLADLTSLAQIKILCQIEMSASGISVGHASGSLHMHRHHHKRVAEFDLLYVEDSSLLPYKMPVGT